MIKTAKAARPAAKKTSVRKSAPVKKAKADLKAKVAAKIPSTTMEARTRAPATPNDELANLRRWAVQEARFAGDRIGLVERSAADVLKDAETLVAFVLNGTVPKA